MSLSTLHTLSGVKTDTDVQAGTSVVIGGIQRYGIRAGTTIGQEPQSGGVESQFQSIYGAAPMFDFSTIQLARALGVLGVNGLPIAAVTNTGVTAYGNKMTQGGGRASGSNHLSFNIKSGFMLPRRISCEHQGNATLDVETLVTWDGTNNPVIETEGVALPTVLDDEYFTLGPIQLGTTNGDKIVLNSKFRVEFDFGLNASAEGSDSDIWPTYATINNAGRRMLRISVYDLTLLKSAGIPLTGKDVDLNYTVIYFRKRKKSATGYVADNVAEHIKMVPLSGCAYHETINEAANGSKGSATIEIPFLGSSSAAAVSITTASAIVLP